MNFPGAFEYKTSSSLIDNNVEVASASLHRSWGSFSWLSHRAETFLCAAVEVASLFAPYKGEANRNKTSRNVLKDLFFRIQRWSFKRLQTEALAQTSHTTDRSGQKVPVYVPLDCEPSHTPLAVSASAFRLGRSSGMFPHGRRAKQPEASRPSCAQHSPVRTAIRYALLYGRTSFPRTLCGAEWRRSLSTVVLLGGMKRQTPPTGSLLTAGPRVPPSRTPPSVQDWQVASVSAYQ